MSITYRDIIAAYARIVARSMPLACATRLSFQSLQDHSAMRADLALLRAHGHVPYPDPAFFVLAEQALSILGGPIPNDGSERQAILKQLETAVVPLIRQMIPLVPLAPDAPWSHPRNHVWERTLAGWSLEVSYLPKVASRYGRGGRVQHHCARAIADVVRGEYVKLDPGQTAAQAKKLIETWATEHDLRAERLRAIESTT